MLISDTYRRLNSDLHDGGSYGRNGDRWAARVQELIDTYGAQSVLDYGCGQGALARAIGEKVREYDPAIPEKANAPAPADLVVCTDVLEHVEPDCLSEVLDHLRQLSRKACFVVIATRPAKKVLADRRNAHLIIEPDEFWRGQLGARFQTVHFEPKTGEFAAVLEPLPGGVKGAAMSEQGSRDVAPASRSERVELNTSSAIVAGISKSPSSLRNIVSPNSTDKQISAPSDAYPSLRPKNAVSRNQVVQSVLDLFEAPRYLEVGVNQGVTFKALKAATKVAVDPKFLFDFKCEAGPNVHFHETTSDDYFGRIATPGTAFDVIYLDGLHTSEQTIRDLVNAFTFLKHDGVIVIDDVFPSSYIASLPERQHTRVVRQATADPLGAWMGDVFRLVFFVETFCQQYSYATINNNHGQLVLWREPRIAVPERTLRQVSDKDYKDMFLERDTFCFAPLAQVVERVRASRAVT